MAPRLRRSKYGAIAERIDGIRFASRAEARRYCQLKLLERAGEISALVLQPRYRLTAANIATGEVIIIGHYVADFRYRTKDGASIVEDVKGVRTPIFKWKKKHTEAEHGITITEVR